MRTQDFRSLLQHAESLVVVFELLVVACGIHFPDQDLLLWEHGVLDSGPPGKSLGERLIRNDGSGRHRLCPQINLSSTKFGTSRHYVPPDVMIQQKLHSIPCDVFLTKEKKFNLKPIKYLHLKPDCKKHREQKSYIMPQGNKSLNQKYQ